MKKELGRFLREESETTKKETSAQETINNETRSRGEDPE